MPDTPIDLSEGIRSVRLKVPTAEVPIPPEGFAQLHSPAPGELALRLPDGSVVPVGGGGGGGTNAVDLLGPNGQVLTDGTEPGVGIDISPIPPLAIRLSGPVQDVDGEPQAPEAVTLVLRDSSPPPPSTTERGALFLDAGANIQVVSPDGSQGTGVVAGSASLRLDPGSAFLSAGDDGRGQINGADAYWGSGANVFEGHSTGLVLTLGSGTLRVVGVPTIDPHVDGALWIAPLTRVLMVSAG